MSFHIVNSEHRLIMLHELIDKHFNEKKWFRVDFTFGSARSIRQNSLSFELYKRIGRALYGNDLEHARAECKLIIGVPILRRDLARFRAVYDRALRPLDYDVKLELIRTTDMPVTRLMTVKMMGEYIDQIITHYGQSGVEFGDLLNNYEYETNVNDRET